MAPERVRVIDARGRELSPTDAERASKLIAAGRATYVAGSPTIIRLPYTVALPEPKRSEPAVAPGTPLLLHVCCGPCATYPVPYLRSLGFEVTGWWYNPNIQPADEHALREESARRLAAREELPLATGGHEPERFEEAVRGNTGRPARCRRCYRLRLEETAHAARQRGIVAFSTTLLISPYQDQAAIREIGEDIAQQMGLRFYFDNLRRGWSQRGRLARKYGLYLQQYCGCRFSLAERAHAVAHKAAGEEAR